MDWHTKARFAHEDEFLMAACWEQEGDIITDAQLKKDGLSWRALVSHTQIEKWISNQWSVNLGIN